MFGADLGLKSAAAGIKVRWLDQSFHQHLPKPGKALGPQQRHVVVSQPLLASRCPSFEFYRTVWNQIELGVELLSMAFDLQDTAKEVKYFRVRIPQGKENEKNRKRMEGNVRLQWALSTTAVAVELDLVLKREVVRQSGYITIEAAPRGVLERDAKALLNKFDHTSQR